MKPGKMIKNRDFLKLNLLQYLKLLLPKSSNYPINKNLSIFEVIRVFSPAKQVLNHALLHFMTTVNTVIEEKQKDFKYLFKLNGEKVQHFSELDVD